MKGMAPAVRAFVAVELDPALREAVADLLRHLQKAVGGVRWVDPEGVHITLKFLGEVEAGRIPPIASALETAVRPLAPFNLRLGTPGAFPDPQRPRVLWLAVEEPTGALARLQRAVEEALTALGFPPEERPFTPHLTLGRVGAQAGEGVRRRAGLALAGLKVPPGLTMRVTTVSLMRSHLSPQGARYTRLARIPLEGEAPTG